MKYLKSFLSIFVLSVYFIQNAIAFDGGNQFLLGKNKQDPLDAEVAFAFNHIQESTGEVFLNWSIEDGYYLYKDKIKIDGADSQIIDIKYSESEIKNDPLFGETSVFHDYASVSFKPISNKQLASTDLSISYQGCWEGGICYPPQKKTIQVNLPAGDGKQVSPESTKGVGIQDKELSLVVNELKDQLKNSTPQSVETEQSKYADVLKNSTTLSLIGIFFLAGLALSLTPCVFPMIPILSGIIAGQGPSVTTRHSLILSITYVLSMALTYTAAGVFAGLFGANIQASLQSPVLITGFSLVFVALAASMFGFYDLQMPSSIQAWLAKNSHKQKGGTLYGVAIMGFLSALIVGPCMAAPLAGALIYIGQTGDPIIGGAALFSLSIGMGLPLILIGASAGKLLPRAGAWMNNVKYGFGVALLLMAVLMLDRIVDIQITMTLTGIILITTGVFLGLFRASLDGEKPIVKLSKAVALIISLYGASLIIGVLQGNTSFIHPLKNRYAENSAEAVNLASTVNTVVDLKNKLTEAAQLNKPAVLDYYADWCVSCNEVEYLLNNEPSIIEHLKDFAFIKVDVTADNDESKQLQKMHNVLGPPALVFYDAKGNYMENLTIVGVPEPDETINILKIVKGN